MPVTKKRKFSVDDNTFPHISLPPFQINYDYKLFMINYFQAQKAKANFSAHEEPSKVTLVRS